MLTVVNVIIYALIVLISVVLVILILMQPSKGGGLGSAFGGVGENVFGAHAMEHLSKVTVWLIAIFFVLTLIMTVLSAHASKSDSSLMKDVKVEDVKAVEPAADVKPAEKAVETTPAAVAPTAKTAEPAPVKAEPAAKPAEKATAPADKTKPVQK